MGLLTGGRERLDHAVAPVDNKGNAGSRRNVNRPGLPGRRNIYRQGPGVGRLGYWLSPAAEPSEGDPNADAGMAPIHVSTRPLS